MILAPVSLEQATLKGINAEYLCRLSSQVIGTLFGGVIVKKHLRVLVAISNRTRSISFLNYPTLSWIGC